MSWHIITYRRSNCCKAPVKFQQHAMYMWYCMACERELVNDTYTLWQTERERPDRDEWSDLLEIMKS